MGYNKITLFPDVKYDYLVLKKGTPNQSEIDIMNSPTVKPNFGTLPNSLIVSPFTDSLISSLVAGLVNPLIAWAVYRQKKGDKRLYLVAEVERSQLFIIDYLCSNQTEYNYIVVPVTSQELGISLESKPITTDWWNYSLTGLQEISNGIYSPTQIWTFDYNLTSTEIVQNTDVTQFKTFTKYAKVSKGESNYQTMGISCLLGGIKCEETEYMESMSLLEKWQEFVAKDILCLWKDRKGSLKIGKIIENPSSKYIDETTQQATTISFNFVETASTQDISVYGIEDKVYNELENI